MHSQTRPEIIFLSSCIVGLPPLLAFSPTPLPPPSSSASPALGDSAVDRFDRAAAFLRSAGTTAVRAAGSLAGTPWVGGVDETGGELQGGSLFCSFGSVVNVNPGGFFGGEGQGVFGGKGQGTGAGSSRADGAMILSSKGSMTLRLSSGSSAHVEDGESPHLPTSPQVIRGGTRRDAQPPAWLDSGLTSVTLGDDASQQLPKIISRKTEKTIFLLPFNLQEMMGGGADTLCCGVVGEGSRFCSKLGRHCLVRDHWRRKKMYDVMDMKDGFYINDAGSGRAFGEPCLPLTAALRSPTFKDLLEDGEGKTLETWSTIFRHLIDRAKDADAAASTPLRGGRTTNDMEDRGLVKFYTDLETPGRVALDSLNSPKQARYNDGEMDEDGDGEPESPAFRATSAMRDAHFDHLRTSLVLVKGELGTQASEAPCPYAMILVCKALSQRWLRLKSGWSPRLQARGWTVL